MMAAESGVEIRSIDPAASVSDDRLG